MKKLSYTKDYIFYSMQGEGRYTGVPSVFVRLTGCNLRCEWKNSDGTINRCDTPYSSFEPEKEMHIISETLPEISKYNCKHVVVTGGEPCLQENMVDLVNGLVDLGHYVTIETNGTIYRDMRAQFYSISPKLKSACNPQTYDFEILKKFLAKDHQLKFVINSPEDILEVNAFLEEAKKITSQKLNIYLMPQALTAKESDEKRAWLTQMCQSNSFNYCERVHVLLWGAKRGV